MELLFREILSHHLRDEVCIEKLIVFASTVSGAQPSFRQNNYFRALKCRSQCIEVVRGKMKKNVIKTGKWVIQKPKGRVITNETKTISIREEKQTDVNIAVRIVEDAYSHANKEYDIACLISNDSDLEQALSIKRKLKQKVIWIPPIPKGSTDKYGAHQLRKHVPKSERVIGISKGVVSSNKLPATVGGYKPPISEGWS